MKQIFLVLLFSSALLAQGPGQSGGAKQGPQAAPQASQQPGRQASPQGTDDLAQMRDDLSRMESLNLNMSSEIEFLRDQNLQILLRTNSQLWTLLIRDLRRQIDREEQRRAAPPASRR